jgi:hypothetical protein
LTASIEPWNTPGASGEPVSAITRIVMSSGVTPTSVACSGSLLHLSAAVVAVVAATVVSLPFAVVALASAVVAGAAVAAGEPELSSLRLQAAAVTASSTVATSADDRDRLPSLMWFPLRSGWCDTRGRAPRSSRRADYTVILSRITL